MAVGLKLLTRVLLVSGIHGMPHQSWGGVQPVAGNEDTGYCTHSSVLFPAWHRPYMALYEVTSSRIFIVLVTGLAKPQTPDNIEVCVCVFVVCC